MIVVGATFAYFTASVSGNESAQSVIVSTAKIGTITYKSGDTVKLENALPGTTSNEVSFTIKADDNSTSNVVYTISWADVTNNFDSKLNDLVYTLTGTNQTSGSGSLIQDKNEVTVPKNNESALIGKGILAPGETHSYQLSVRFKETGSDQNSNQGKSFTGKIVVNTGDENGSQLYYTSGEESGTTTMPSDEDAE